MVNAHETRVEEIFALLHVITQFEIGTGRTIMHRKRPADRLLTPRAGQFTIESY